MTALAVSALIVFSLDARLPEAIDTTGSWRLNVQKSRWGKKPKPHAVTVTIRHNEPSIQYSGEAVVSENGETRHFEFEGAYDGKSYPYRDGVITLQRVNATTTTSVYQSGDGSITETARTTIAAGGKVMTRKITLKNPDGAVSWTEIYEKSP